MANDKLRTIPVDIEMKNHLYVFVECNQFDILDLQMHIWDNGNKADLSGCRFRLIALKRDNNTVIQNSGISVDDNVVKLTTHEQFTTVSGRIRMQLNVIDKATDYVKSSFYIVVFINPSPLEIEGKASSSVVTILDQLNIALDRVENIGDVLDQALKAMKDLQNTIDDSVNKNETLSGTIQIGNNLNTNLKAENVQAENNINKATPLNEDLKNNINKATPLNEDLKKNIVVAEPLNEDLKDNIAIGKVVNSRLESNSKDLEEDLDKILGGVIFTDENGKIITSDENIPLATRNYEGMYEGYENHISNTEIHITKDERSKWNKNITDLTDLTNNINSVVSNLKTHEDDTIKHISVEERKLLNFHSEQINSILNLLDIALSGTAFTDENGNILTDENSKIIAM